MTNNKLKLGLSVALVLAFFLGAQTAMAADITFTGSVTVSLTNPAIDLTIVGGSEATEVEVNTGTIVVTLAGEAGTFTITSPRSLDVTGETDQLSVTDRCGSGGVSTVTLTPGSSDEVVTITPGASDCLTSTSPGGGGGGGGVAAAEAAGEEAGITLPYAHPVTATEIRANIRTLQVELVSLLQQLIQMFQSQLQGL